MASPATAAAPLLTKIELNTVQDAARIEQLLEAAVEQYVQKLPQDGSRSRLRSALQAVSVSATIAVAVLATTDVFATSVAVAGCFFHFHKGAEGHSLRVECKQGT